MIDDIYKKLIESGFSESELDRQIEKKAKEYDGFMSKQGILFIIAKENGITIQSPAIDPELYSEMEREIDYDEFAIKIAEVKEGMISIVLFGKILKISPINEFSRKDGTIGMVSSCIIGDSSGEIKIVLWDEQAKVVESDVFQEGQIVRVIGEYAKQNTRGNLEVHIGKKGKLILDPPNISRKIKEELQEIRPLKKTVQGKVDYSNNSIMKLVSKQKFIKKIQGIVHIDEFKEINKKDGTKIFLLKLILSDESGTIPVNIWGMNAIETLKILENGVRIIFTNVSIKFNSYTNEKELSFTRSSSLQII